MKRDIFVKAGKKATSGKITCRIKSEEIKKYFL